MSFPSFVIHQSEAGSRSSAVFVMHQGVIGIFAFFFFFFFIELKASEVNCRFKKNKNVNLITRTPFEALFVHTVLANPQWFLVDTRMQSNGANPLLLLFQRIIGK